MKQEIIISTDSELLDRDFIHGFISRSYWAEGRSIEEMNTCIANSLNFGVYSEGRQIGYARVVSDTVQFAYIMDLFIDPEHRGNGHSKALMAYMLGSEELNRVKVWRLATKDAHSLYHLFGFQSLKHPGNMLELMR